MKIVDLVGKLHMRFTNTEEYHIYINTIQNNIAQDTHIAMKEEKQYHIHIFMIYL